MELNVTSYSFVVLLKFAVIVQSPVNLAPQLFVHPENVYVNSSLLEVGAAVIVVVQIVNVFHSTEIFVHQSFFTLPLVTVPYHAEFTLIVAVYWFTDEE